MTIELAALILAIIGPLATAVAVYLRGKKTHEAVSQLRINDLAHLEGRLEQIEQRLGRVEGWMFEHQRNHSG